ncbi:hypothetical protein ABIA31_008082 [Catenulispora sp. MAP5-51]
MRVLLTESAPGAADQAEQRLREAGYDISFCHPDHRADEDGCVVLRGIGHCPLRTDADTGAVVDARSPDAPAFPTAREFGSCCALRNHLPRIVTGLADTGRFPWIGAAAICTTDKLACTCERLTRPVEAALRRDASPTTSPASNANATTASPPSSKPPKPNNPTSTPSTNSPSARPPPCWSRHPAEQTCWSPAHAGTAKDATECSSGR